MTGSVIKKSLSECQNDAGDQSLSSQSQPAGSARWHVPHFGAAQRKPVCNPALELPVKCLVTALASFSDGMTVAALGKAAGRRVARAGAGG